MNMINEAGFNHVSIGGNYNHSNILDKENRKVLHKQIRDNDLLVDTIHGCGTDNPNRDKILDEIIEAAREFETPVIVLHPLTGFEILENEIEQKLSLLLETCSKYKPKLEQYGIKFAIENLHPENATEVLKRGLPQLDKDNFGFCYDSSHDQVDGPRDFSLLEQFGDRVIAVHLSDRIRPFVDHAVPGEGFVDFNEISRLLRKSHYSNPITLELMIMNSQYKNHEDLLRKGFIEGEKIHDSVFKAD